MRTFLVVSILAATLTFLSAPMGAQADRVDVYSGETPAQMMDRLRAEAVNGNLDAAIAELSDYVRDHPTAIVAARLLGDFYYRKPDIPAAERVYKEIVYRFPQDRETWNRLGGIYAAEDRIDEAIAAFDRSVPEPSAYPNLVELHRRRGDLRQFEEDVAAQAKRNPTDERTLLIYGNVLRAVHKYDGAIATLEQALQYGHDRCPPLNDLANTYLDMGRVSDAIPLLQQCLAMEPKAYFALVNLGDAYIMLGRYDVAQTWLQRAVQEDAYRAEAYVDIGYLQDVAQRWKSAMSYYEKAIDVDPMSRDAYIDLGYDYNEQGLYTLAEAAFLKGLAVAPHDGRLAFMLGMTYGLQGKLELAKQEYQRALADSDEDVVLAAARQELSSLRTRQP